MTKARSKGFDFVAYNESKDVYDILRLKGVRLAWRGDATRKLTIGIDMVYQRSS
jgi:hypothetical protein